MTNLTAVPGSCSVCKHNDNASWHNIHFSMIVLDCKMESLPEATLSTALRLFQGLAPQAWSVWLSEICQSSTLCRSNEKGPGLFGFGLAPMHWHILICIEVLQPACSCAPLAWDYLKRWQQPVCYMCVIFDVSFRPLTGNVCPWLKGELTRFSPWIDQIFPSSTSKHYLKG